MGLGPEWQQKRAERLLLDVEQEGEKYYLHKFRINHDQNPKLKSK